MSLLRLHQGLDLNNSPNISPTCWPTVTPAVGLQVLTSGWGLTFQHFGLFGSPKILQKVVQGTVIIRRYDNDQTSVLLNRQLYQS